jgi:hypothetical protein
MSGAVGTSRCGQKLGTCSIAGHIASSPALSVIKAREPPKRWISNEAAVKTFNDMPDGNIDSARTDAVIFLGPGHGWMTSL